MHQHSFIKLRSEFCSQTADTELLAGQTINQPRPFPCLLGNNLQYSNCIPSAIYLDLVTGTVSTWSTSADLMVLLSLAH